MPSQNKTAFFPLARSTLGLPLRWSRTRRTAEPCPSCRRDSSVAGAVQPLPIARSDCMHESPGKLQWTRAAGPERLKPENASQLQRSPESARNVLAGPTIPSPRLRAVELSNRSAHKIELGKPGSLE